MKIAIIGAGGVGGYLAARLAAGGLDITLIARGPRLTAIRSAGLLIENPLGDVAVKGIRATDDPREVGPTDFVIITVKLWDMDPAVQAIKPIVTPQTAVVSFQNGVQKTDVLQVAFGAEHVLGGIAQISVSMVRPGVIRQAGEWHKFTVGSFAGQDPGRARALVDAFTHADIHAVLSSNIEKDMWEEYALVVGVSALTAATRQPIGPIRENPRSRELLLDVMREVVAVGQARGIDLPTDVAEHQLAIIDTLPPGLRASMAIDVERGNRLELAWLSGGVVTLGREAGVPTPVNRAIADILSLYAEGRHS
jgi:2-dehydropantoate 2-reductase